MPKGLDAIDTLIRDGRGAEAQGEILAAAKEESSRESRRRLAELAWRSGIPETGVRLLAPVVRTRLPSVRPTDSEKAEYAQCLAKLGAEDEAVSLLREVKVESLPRASFFLGTALIRQWNYAEALPHLKRYARSALPPYEKIVAQVNLASAFAYLREFQKASYLLRDLVYVTGVRKLHLLHGNCLELSAYNCLVNGKWKRARSFLDKGAELLAKAGNQDGFYISKWLAILELLENGSVSAVEKLRGEALARKQFETVRDCDRFEAVATRSEARLWHVYFGTPFASFRERLLSDYARKIEVPETFTWRLGPESDRCLDVARGEGLNPGGSLHRLLAALASDFYRPQRIPSLFARVFPGEFYNPETSAARVHQAIHGLRGWIERTGFPLEISADKGLCQLSSPKGCRVLVPRDPAGGDRRDFLLETLRREFGTDPFSAQQAAEFLGKSGRTVLRSLTAGREAGVLTRTGSRAQSRYRFTS